MSTTNPIDSVLNAVSAETGREARKSGDGFVTCCPAHDDNNPSLKISERGDGTVGIHCFAGCCPEDVLASVGLTLADLFPVKGDGRQNPMVQPKRSGSVTPKVSKTFPSVGDAIDYFSQRHRDVQFWTYEDAGGGPVGVVIRWDTDKGKEFRPLSRSDGGWMLCAMPKPRPLYRLPDVKASDRVYVAEGEKAADALRSFGLVATTSPGGCKAAKHADWSVLAGKDVVLVPDNDEPGEMFAESVVGILSRELPGTTVRIIRLKDIWPEIPDGGGDAADFSEHFDGQSPETLAVQIEELTMQTAPIKVSNEQHSSTRLAFQPFPVDLLPEPVRCFVNSGAKAIGCDPAAIVMPLLAVLGSAIGNTRRLSLKASWHVPPILWTVTIGESGSQKSPAFAFAAGLVTDHEQELDRKYQSLLTTHREGQKDHERQYAAWKRTGEGTEPCPPDEPIEERWSVDDTTIEAIVPLLTENRRGLLVATDELAGWIAGFDKYRSGKSSGDVSRWLSMYNAGTVRVDRKSGDVRRLYVPRAAVCVTGTIQPGTLSRSIGQEHRDNGLLARLLLAYPLRSPKRWSEFDVDQAQLQRMRDVISQLRSLEFATNDNGEAVPAIVCLSDRAKKLWVEFYNSHDTTLADASGELAAAYSKLEEIPARLALIMHLVRSVTDQTIDPSVIDSVSMVSAIGLAEWFIHETTRIYAILDRTAEEHRVAELAGWIRTNGGRMTARDIQRRKKLKSSDEAEAMLDSLVKAEFGSWKPVAPGPSGGRPTREFVLFDLS
jgi:hypothetical protein